MEQIIFCFKLRPNYLIKPTSFHIKSKKWDSSSIGPKLQRILNNPKYSLMEHRNSNIHRQSRRSFHLQKKYVRDKARIPFSGSNMAFLILISEKMITKKQEKMSPRSEFLNRLRAHKIKLPGYLSLKWKFKRYNFWNINCQKKTLGY